jgi:hypothetical protein
MEAATDKQIKFAKHLGINEAESFSKQALKEMIDQKLQKDKGIQQPAQQKAYSEPVMASNFSYEHIMVTRVDKPHSYEFGKAGSRHKVYYSTITELKAHMQELMTAGMVSIEDLGQIPEES